MFRTLGLFYSLKKKGGEKNNVQVAQRVRFPLRKCRVAQTDSKQMLLPTRIVLSPVFRNSVVLTTNHFSLQSYLPKSSPFVFFPPKVPLESYLTCGVINLIINLTLRLCLLWNFMDKICSASIAILPHIKELVLRLPTVLPLYLVPPRLYIWQRLLRPLTNAINYIELIMPDQVFKMLIKVWEF